MKIIKLLMEDDNMPSLILMAGMVFIVLFFNVFKLV